MAYTPINTQAYTAAYSGAVASMAVNGWITSPTGSNYTLVCAIAGAFAQAFDIAWNSATDLNSLESAAIQSVCQQEFSLRAPGPLQSNDFANPDVWTVAAIACVTLVLQCGVYFAGQGITPPTPGSGSSQIVATVIGRLDAGDGGDTPAGGTLYTVPAGSSGLYRLAAFIGPATVNGFGQVFLDVPFPEYPPGTGNLEFMSPGALLGPAQPQAQVFIGEGSTGPGKADFEWWVQETGVITYSFTGQWFSGSIVWAIALEKLVGFSNPNAP